MKHAVLLITAPVLCVVLCGAAAAEQEGDVPTRLLFAKEPLRESFADRPATAAVVVADTHDTESDGAETGPSSRVMNVTSDSRAYCTRLMHTIDAHDAGSLSSSVVSLRHEGQRLCSEGYVRLGVTRLREALAIIKGRTIQK
jgi:hypothetical protein